MTAASTYAAVVLVAIAVASPAAADTVLDKFVGDLVTTCALSPTLKQVRQHYSNRFAPQNASPTTALPAALAGQFGTPKIERGDGYVTVHVPIAAAHRGLKATELTFAIGLQNGIDAQTVTFAAPLDAVEAKLGDSVRKIRAKGVEGIEVLLESRGDATDYVCDHSM